MNSPTTAPVKAKPTVTRRLPKTQAAMAGVWTRTGRARGAAARPDELPRGPVRGEPPAQGGSRDEAQDEPAQGLLDRGQEVRVEGRGGHQGPQGPAHVGGCAEEEAIHPPLPGAHLP